MSLSDIERSTSPRERRLFRRLSLRTAACTPYHSSPSSGHMLRVRRARAKRDIPCRKKHAEGQKYDGINAKKGSICNMYVAPVVSSSSHALPALAQYRPFWLSIKGSGFSF
jgi:hypothetical protein